LAILNDYKGAGELFIKCFADLIVLGEEIGNLVIKDIDFFGSLFLMSASQNCWTHLKANKKWLKSTSPRLPQVERLS